MVGVAEMETAIVGAISTLIAAFLSALVVVWGQRKKQPIDESTAAYANAKVLSDASADWVESVRADMVALRADMEQQRQQQLLANQLLRAEVEALRVENAELRAENQGLVIDLDAVYDWVAAGAIPPPPTRRHRP